MYWITSSCTVEEIKHYNLKEDFLKDVSSIKLKGNKDEDVKTIKNKINEWKSIGRVPYNKRNIEQKFNKVLDGLFNKLDLDKKEAELIKFENRYCYFVKVFDSTIDYFWFIIIFSPLERAFFHSFLTNFQINCPIEVLI